MKRILIIDDNEPNREVLGWLFRDEGFEARLLPDPVGIESQLEQFSPDVVLMDVMMGRFNGVDICQRIKSSPQYAGIKILLMTASNIFNSVDVSKTSADAHIPKPFDIEELAELVDGMLQN